MTASEQPRTRLVATVLGAPDPRELAAFYERLLGWPRTADKPNWVTLRPPGGGTGLSFQHEANYVPPVWPSQRDAPQIMMHLDIAVESLDDDGVALASAAGAVLAESQPQDQVRVMLDPAGHPFCLFVGQT